MTATASDITLFDRKTLRDFSASLRRAFHLLAISRKIRVVGSAGLKNIRYVSDYDLNEIYQRKLNTPDTLDAITQLFQDKFKRCLQDDSCFITDFKCGLDSDGAPLRWNKHEMQKGTKTLKDGRSVSFQDCILQKGTMKLDLVKLIRGRFVEISDNYFIQLGDKANFNKREISKPAALESLRQDFQLYFNQEMNLFKGLKRAFSFYFLQSKTKNRDKLLRLIALFNSPVGHLYQLLSQLKTIKLVSENENEFRKPKKRDILHNLQLIQTELRNLNIPKVADVLDEGGGSLLSLSRAHSRLLALLNTLLVPWLAQNQDIPL